MGVALIQAVLNTARMPLNEQQLWDRIVERAEAVTPSQTFIRQRVLQTPVILL